MPQQPLTLLLCPPHIFSSLRGKFLAHLYCSNHKFSFLGIFFVTVSFKFLLKMIYKHIRIFFLSFLSPLPSFIPVSLLPVLLLPGPHTEFNCSYLREHDLGAISRNTGNLSVMFPLKRGCSTRNH